MSLINKMLQDLDARGSQAGSGLPPDVRSVPRERERGVPRAVVLGGAAGLTALAIAFGWTYWPRPTVLPAPAVAPMPMPVVVMASAPVVAAPPEPQIIAPPAPVAAPHETPAVVEKTAPKKVGQVKAGKNEGAVQAAAEPLQAAVPALEGKQANLPPRAENDYRRALDALQDGRVPEALARLQQALAIDPRHQAARETLVRLLLEAQRPDEAMRQLQLSLSLDPKQPAQAMMLARLQVEQGGPALDTLMRTLPFAADHGEYRAFLAGVLQRQQRNKEAAEQYQQALQHAPHNGVWWMGLGISLQADQRPAEAKEAFSHARVSGNLSPELQAFVERKLLQLAQKQAAP
ncbi:tetratricopeptide repeat protein [Janthinobacterium agaricidamnosum]|uniref:Tetratricopeptide repeat family protein n=1 Tax=Janthinobacterium agaricidamnosum NBRC 102515 = DSM 9628 TaxID=1349767 RepID=W0V4F0_9BURK|nr:tetratricopeptide repeat protein [Janthinobacterium agaricidamnosum]CDG82761.1 tetratricopeptide repeat family protein [Janthinobacterium agaricidamnosum NBRC 102515 = DSM 9628]